MPRRSSAMSASLSRPRRCWNSRASAEFGVEGSSMLLRRSSQPCSEIAVLGLGRVLDHARPPVGVTVPPAAVEPHDGADPTCCPPRLGRNAADGAPGRQRRSQRPSAPRPRRPPMRRGRVARPDVTAHSMRRHTVWHGLSRQQQERHPGLRALKVAHHRRDETESRIGPEHQTRNIAFDARQREQGRRPADDDSSRGGIASLTGLRRWKMVRFRLKALEQAATDVYQRGRLPTMAKMCST